MSDNLNVDEIIKLLKKKHLLVAGNFSKIYLKLKKVKLRAKITVFKNPFAL